MTRKALFVILWNILVWNVALYGIAIHTGCAEAQKTISTIAPLVDPLLRIVGFCKEHGAPKDRVTEVIEAYKSGDRIGAALKAGLLLEELRASGIEVPSDVGLDMIRTVAAIEGMQRGLRAISCLNPDTGQPVPGCK